MHSIDSPVSAVADPVPVTTDARLADLELAADDMGSAPRVLAPFQVRLINFLAVTIPFVSLIVAIALLWGVAFNWVYLALLVGMVLLTGLGITIGYHRLFTHRSFETPRFVQHALAILGSMAVEGPLLEWVATHRKHHQHSDGDHDPHSPHGHGETLRGVFHGFVHAHFGWLFLRRARDITRYSADLRRDKGLRRTSDLFVLWVVVGLVVPALIGGLVTWSWTGALLGFLWGGLVRVFVVHHITWSINSVCHLWGGRPFAAGDESRNNVVFGVLGFGEGWHNNHHAFPTSARHGLFWWQFDLSYVIIRVMGFLGLAWKIKVPTAERMAAKRVVTQ